MFGCFHAEAAGVLPNDVHVIDLTSGHMAGGPGGPGRRARSVNPPEVDLVLVPDNLKQKQEDKDDKESLTRNLSLILKSHTPVKWLVQSHGITGRLVIIAGQSDTNSSSIS